MKFNLSRIDSKGAAWAWFQIGFAYGGGYIQIGIFGKGISLAWR